MIYFDSDVQVGKFGLKHRLTPWSKTDILKIMDECGIAAALVHSGYAKDYAPKFGNAELSREIASSKRLYGCYTIIPNTYDDFYSPEGVIADMRKNSMVAARMFPKSYCFEADENTMGEYFRALEKEKIPLFIHASEIELQTLAALLSAHPSLSVVLQDAFWGEDRRIVPLLRAHDNLYIDMSSFQTNHLVELLPAERLLFGSRLPHMSAGAARAFVDYADIDEKSRAAIAGGNLARLLGVNLPEQVEVKNDSIALEASRAEPISTCVFDSHTHVLGDDGGCGGAIPMPRGDLESSEKLFRRIGVDSYVVAPWLGIWTDAEAGNKTMLDMQKRGGNPTAYGYVLIDPNYTRDVERQASYYHIENRVPGMKMFYNRTKVLYDDAVFDPWWKIANEHNLFALLDCSGHPKYLDTVLKLAEKYPNVSMFLDHSGSSFENAEKCAEYAKKRPNIFLQITYTSVTQGVIEYFVSEGLADKTLYGTDMPMRDPRPQLGWVVYANISESDKRKILGENMQKILERVRF